MKISTYILTEMLYLRNAMSSVQTSELLSYYSRKGKQTNLFIAVSTSHNTYYVIFGSQSCLHVIIIRTIYRCGRGWKTLCTVSWYLYKSESFPIKCYQYTEVLIERKTSKGNYLYLKNKLQIQPI